MTEYNIRKFQTEHLKEIAEAYKDFLAVKGCIEILSPEAQQDIKTTGVAILRELERRKKEDSEEV